MRSHTILFTVLLAASCQAPPQEYDILIKNGTVVDGTGSPGSRADVAIANGAIAAIGPLEGAQGKRVLDAEGRIVSPGFIDMSYSVGIDHLLVNGDIVIHDGEMTGSLPGKVLRHRS
jgi:N-acyl-D-amino-acid deacylase